MMPYCKKMSNKYGTGCYGYQYLGKMDDVAKMHLAVNLGFIPPALAFVPDSARTGVAHVKTRGGSEFPTPDSNRLSND